MSPLEKLLVIYLIGVACFTAMFYIAAQGNAEMRKHEAWIPYQALIYGALWPFFIWFTVRGVILRWMRR